MNYTTHKMTKILIMFFMVCTGIIFISDKAVAATQNLTVNNNEMAYATINANDTGTITPNLYYI